MDLTKLVGTKRPKPIIIEEEKDESPNSSSQPLPEKDPLNPQTEDEEGVVLSEQIQELIDLYGNSIRVIRWCFENNSVVKNKKHAGFGG